MNLFKDIYKYSILGYLIGWIIFCIILCLDILRDYSLSEHSDMTWVAYQAVIIIMCIFEIGFLSFAQSIIFWLILKFKRFTYKNISFIAYVILALIYNILLYVYGNLIPDTFYHTNYIISIVIAFVFPLIIIALFFYSYILYKERLTKNKQTF